MNTFVGEMRGRTWRTCSKPSPVMATPAWVDDQHLSKCEPTMTHPPDVDRRVRGNPPSPCRHTPRRGRPPDSRTGRPTAVAPGGSARAASGAIWPQGVDIPLQTSFAVKTASGRSGPREFALAARLRKGVTSRSGSGASASSCGASGFARGVMTSLELSALRDRDPRRGVRHDGASTG